MWYDAGYMKRRLQTLCSDDIPVAQRIRRWTEFVSETYAEFGFDASDPRTFRSRLSRIQFGSLGMSWFEASASAGHAKRSQVGLWSAPLSDAFILCLQEHGHMTGHQFGVDMQTGPGDMTLLDATRPWDVSSTGDVSVITIKIPSERMLAIVANPMQNEVLPFRRNHRTRASFAIISALKQAIEAAPDEDWDDRYEDVLLGAISTLFTDPHRMNETGAREETLRRKAIAHVENNLADFELDGEAIAAALDISLRSLQRLFQCHGYTPRSYILERRLITAASMLQKGEGDGLRISQVAFSLGFNDLSYFTRTFRKRYGVSPRAYRTSGPVDEPMTSGLARG